MAKEEGEPTGKSGVGKISLARSINGAGILLLLKRGGGGEKKVTRGI
jgi:hypothetical protein